MTVEINAAQVEPFIEALQDHADGEEVALTPQGNGSLVLGFSLVTVEIDAEGNAEEI